MSLRRVCCALLVVCGVAGCASSAPSPVAVLPPTAPPQPTYTALPTYTPYPTLTPYPTAPPPSATPAATSGAVQGGYRITVTRISHENPCKKLLVGKELLTIDVLVQNEAADVARRFAPEQFKLRDATQLVYDGGGGVVCNDSVLQSTGFSSHELLRGEKTAGTLLFILPAPLHNLTLVCVIPAHTASGLTPQTIPALVFEVPLIE